MQANRRKSQSVARLLSRLLVVLSALGILLALAAIGAGTFSTVFAAQRILEQEAQRALGEFDLFVSDLRRDLLVTAGALIHSNHDGQILRQSLQRNPAIFSITAISLGGQLLEQRSRLAGVTAQPINVQEWSSTVAAGGVYIGPVDSSAFGVPFIQLVVPASFDDGTVYGALVADIDLTAMQTLVSEMDVYGSGYAYILNRADGRLLVYRDLARVQAGETFREALTVDRRVFPGSLGITMGLNGEMVVSIRQDFRSVNWVGVVEAPLWQVLRPYQPVLIVLVTVLIVIVVLVVVTLRFVRQRVTMPLNALRHSVEELRAGNMAHRVNGKYFHPDEIGLLGETLNEMAEQVETRNRTLEWANQMAQESSRVKSEFLATMSHELRTPLNAILGFSGVLLGGMAGKIDEKAHKLISRVEVNARRLLSLINDVLDISKIEAGRMELIETSISPAQLVEAWKAEIEVMAAEKGLTVTTEIDPALPPQLVIDKDRLTQIVSNLLSNAVKFTEKGGVRLTWTARGKIFTIQVEDTGVGIPPHAMNYIFEEFRQVDGSYRRVYGGTGLGLAIVRHLCRLMGGMVQVSSELGKGSTFTVTLPLKTAADEPVQPVQPVQSTASEG